MMAGLIQRLTPNKFTLACFQMMLDLALQANTVILAPASRYVSPLVSEQDARRTHQLTAGADRTQGSFKSRNKH